MKINFKRLRRDRKRNQVIHRHVGHTRVGDRYIKIYTTHIKKESA